MFDQLFNWLWNSYVLPTIINFPGSVAFLALVGFLRVTVKPAMTFFKFLASKTSTKKDDEAIEKVELSEYYKWFLWFLDLFTSVKITPKK